MTATQDFNSQAVKVLDIEARAIDGLKQQIGESFTAACQLILECDGRIVVTGMGKSGHIGGKIAATLASTGTPSFFVHPGEASHGDLGMITRSDLVIAISNSGETDEVLTIIPLLKRLGVPLIAMTGKNESTLSNAANVTLNVSVAEEACPLNLAPTASTTATLAMGDALAVALLHSRGFTEEDFAMSHPGGSLGRRLLLNIEDLMHKGDDLPVVGESNLLADGLVEMSGKGLGMTTVVDESGILTGILTDGDLRRALNKPIDIRSTRVAEVMTRGCKTVTPDMLAAEAVRLLEEHKINGLVAVDENNKPVGALNVHDLFRAGVM